MSYKLTTVIVSACLLGRKCRYDGRDCLDKSLIEALKDCKVVGVCPEELGGLKGKRGPFEIIGKAEDVFFKKAKVVGKKGEDVTESFIKGTERAFKIAVSNKIKLAILKSRSPSCSPDFVYDGTFNNILRKGLGLFAYLLKNSGIIIVNNEKFVKYQQHFIEGCRC